MSDLDAYVEEYEWYADEGTYTPTSAERFMLLDAILGWEDRKDQLSNNTTLIEKLEEMKKKKCVGYCPSEHIQSAKIQSYNQAIQDVIDLIKEHG